jgi:hypothetical protein
MVSASLDMARRSGIRAGATSEGVDKKEYACKIGAFSLRHNYMFKLYRIGLGVFSLN